MMIKKIVTAGFSLLLGLMFCGCTNSMDSVINSYNGKFQIETIDEQEQPPAPGDAGFNEKEMIPYEQYFVLSTETFQIVAPKNCYSYLWTVYLPHQKEEYMELVEVEHSGGTTKDSREFILHIPTCGLKEGESYVLNLTVEDKAGKKYRDSAGLIIYKPYIL